MFSTARIYVAIALAAGTLLVAAVLVFVGYRVGELRVQAQWDRTEKDRAEAIVGLAQRYADADAEAQRLRTASETVVTQRVREVRREIVKIPVRLACGHSNAEYRVLLDTFCAGDPTAAQCLHRSVPAAEPAAAGTGQP